MWGLSGTVAELVFSKGQFSPLWLVGVRLFFAGLLLLGWYAATDGKHVWDIWRQPKNALRLILFALFGMIPSQLTYYMAISYGNAPTATVLQFLGIVFIILYLAVAQRKLPRRIDTISMIIALSGTFLLVTNGRFDALALAPLALIWGLLAGLGETTYTLLPSKLLEEFDARSVVGWGMDAIGEYSICMDDCHNAYARF